MIMNKNRHIFALVALALFGMFAGISCNPEEVCLEDTQALVNIGFYQLVNGIEKDTTLQGLSVRGKREPDSLLYDSLLNVSAVSVPLSQLDDHADFIFTFTLQDTIYVTNSIPVIDSIGTRQEPDTVFEADTFYVDFITVPDTFWTDSVFILPELEYYPETDTVHFFYERSLNLISDECGFTHFFTLSDVISTENVIDHLTVTAPEIEISDEEHIKIFF